MLVGINHSIAILKTKLEIYIQDNFLIERVAEWLKANDSKSFNRQLFVGSNPTLSVF